MSRTPAAVVSRSRAAGHVSVVCGAAAAAATSPASRPCPHPHPTTTFPTARSYYDLSKWNERFERAYLLNAREYAAWERRQKEALDNERKLMAAVPGFEVNKPRFYTGYQRTPHWTDTVSHDMDRSNYA